MTELEELRSEIEKTDLEILGLMKKRLDLAAEVGRYKIEHGREVVDAGVEDRVVRRYREFAEENGMDPDNAERVCRLIIWESVEAQKAQRE